MWRELRRLHTGPRENALRTARTCYDRLAGRLGVAIADSLVSGGLLFYAENATLGHPRQMLTRGRTRAVAVTPKGQIALRDSLGVRLD
jgi:hypothetical protein